MRNKIESSEVMWLNSLQVWEDCYAYTRPECTAVRLSQSVRSMYPQHLELHKIWLGILEARGHLYNQVAS